jgi:hypothetical protein
MGRSKATNIVLRYHEEATQYVRMTHKIIVWSKGLGCCHTCTGSPIMCSRYGSTWSCLYCASTKSSYSRFVDFLHECIGVQQFPGLSRIPHYTTIQKAAARLSHDLLIGILRSFVLHARIGKIFTGIDSTGFSHGQASITTQNASDYEEICQNLDMCRHGHTWYVTSRSNIGCGTIVYILFRCWSRQPVYLSIRL